MRKKSLAISNIVMLVAAVFCVAVFGAGAVWAYNANLAMKLPAEFNFSNLTLQLGGNAIYANGTINNQNFTITPVDINTLEVSATYQNFGNAKTIAFSSAYTMSLVKAVAYGVDLGVNNVSSEGNNTFGNNFLSYTVGSSLQITLTSAVVPSETDIMTFQILFVQAAN